MRIAKAIDTIYDRLSKIAQLIGPITKVAGFLNSIDDVLYGKAVPAGLQALQNVWNAIADAAERAWNAIKNLPFLPHAATPSSPEQAEQWDKQWQDFQNRLHRQGKPPGMAEGGIVTKPTVALVGEKGPEAVVPLTGATSKWQEIFGAAERVNNLPPGLLSAIAKQENVAAWHNNPLGLSTDRGVMTFSPEEAVWRIYKQAALLNNPRGLYHDFARTHDIRDLAKVWSPVGAKNDIYGTNSTEASGILANMGKSYAGGPVAGCRGSGGHTFNITHSPGDININGGGGDAQAIGGMVQNALQDQLEDLLDALQHLTDLENARAAAV